MGEEEAMNFLLENPEIDRTDLGDIGESANIAEEQNLDFTLDRLPQVPQGQTDPPMSIGDLET
jgi:hypothetical protein